MSAIRLPDLSKLHAKTVVRCECKLVQFQTGETCRRCKLPFEVVEVAATPLPSAIPPAEAKVLPFCKIKAPGRDGLSPYSSLNLSKATTSELDKRVASAIWLLRITMDWSQREVSKRIGAPRTYMSKVERGQSACTIASMVRFASAFEMTPYGLMLIAEAIQ